MKLNAWAAQKRLALFDELKAGGSPSLGDFDADVLREGRMKGAPQVGTTRYSPFLVSFEFVFPDPTTTATILTVTVKPPERIVFLPVPDWVIESIWQGSIEGSAHFESDAVAMLNAFQSRLSADANGPEFAPRPPTHRE